MTKMPPTSAKADAALFKSEAVAYAREWVRMIRDEKISFCGLPLSWLAKPDSERLIRHFMKEMAQSPQGMMDLISLARARLRLADEASRELIIEYQHRNEEMPPSLKAYSMEIADPRRVYRRRPAQKKGSNLLRDFSLTCIVGDVCGKFDLPPTRQRSQRLSKRDRLSGCYILALALREERLALSESAVVSIWTRYGRIAFPSGVRALVHGRYK